MTLIPIPSAASSILSHEKTHLTDDDALRLDAAELAYDRSISIDDAIREMQLDRVTYDVTDNVIALAGDDLMGMWIDREPKWILRVATGDPSTLAQIEEVLSSAELPHEVLHRKGPTEAMLRDRADLLARQVDQGGEVVGVEVDVRNGGLRIFARAGADASRLKHLAPDLRVEVELVDEEVGNASRGGVAMSSCTAGFPVTKPSTSQVGLVTAGHCGNAQSAATTPTGTPTLSTTYTSQNWSSSADLQFNRMSSVSGSFFGGSASTPTLTGTPANSVVGHYICHRGKTTGYSCGYVNSTKYAPTWSNACNGAACSAVFTRVDSSTLANLPGDSGGPWFNGGVPVGIHMGGLFGEYATWAVYTPISRLSSLSIGVL